MHIALFPSNLIHAECVAGDIDLVSGKRVTIGCFPGASSAGNPASPASSLSQRNNPVLSGVPFEGTPFFHRAGGRCGGIPCAVPFACVFSGVVFVLAFEMERPRSLASAAEILEKYGSRAMVKAGERMSSSGCENMQCIPKCWWIFRKYPN